MDRIDRNGNAWIEFVDHGRQGVHPSHFTKLVVRERLVTKQHQCSQGRRSPRLLPGRETLINMTSSERLASACGEIQGASHSLPSPRRRSLRKGAAVTVMKDFESDSSTVVLKKGIRGIVDRIDRNGNAWIEFADHGRQ